MSDAVPARAARWRAPISLVGIVLVFLYLVCVLSVVVGFSAYVMRTDWSTAISVEGDGVQDLDYLIYLVRQDASLTAKVDALQAQIAEADANLDAAAARIEVLRSHLAESNIDLIEAASEASETDLLLEPVAPIGSNTQIPAKLTTPTQFANMDDVGLSPEEQKLSLEITRIKDDLANAELDRERWRESRLHFLTLRNAEQAALDTLQETLPVQSVHRGRWNSLHETGWSNPMGALVPLPTILLTLIATIAAGALGSLVGYSRSAFQADERLSCSNLLINVGEGIAAAIGVFLFAGAGMLVLSQGGGPGGRLELSPFTVAFLAFLSGFMAESAFTKITSFGRDLFHEKERKTEAKPEETTPPSESASTA